MKFWRKKKKKTFLMCYTHCTSLMISQNLKSCGSIFLKALLIFPKDFLDFRLDTAQKQDIINLSSYGRMSYASVVLSGSKVAIHGKGKMQPFVHFFIEFWLYCMIEEACHQIFLSSIFLEVFDQCQQLFFFFWMFLELYWIHPL